MTKKQLYYVDKLLKANYNNPNAIYYITPKVGIVATGAMYLKFYENLDGIINSNCRSFDFEAFEKMLKDRFASKLLSMETLNLNDYNKYYINENNIKFKNNCFDRKLYKLFYNLMTKRAKFMIAEKEMVVPPNASKKQEILFAKSKKAEGMLLPFWRQKDEYDDK